MSKIMYKKKLNILLTGATRGLGKEIAEKLSSNKVNVIGIDLSPVKNNNNPYNYLDKYYQFDLSKVDEIPLLMKKIINENKNIDILINNASVRLFRNFDAFTYDEIDSYIKVNMHAVFTLTHSIIPSMKSNNFGRIINISSISAYNGYSTGSLYCSTKMGLITFAESLSREFKNENNITINTICPDSFRKIDGQKVMNYENIIGSIIKSIDKIINSNVNGRVYNAFILRNRLLSFLLYLKKSMNFMK